MSRIEHLKYSSSFWQATLMVNDRADKELDGEIDPIIYAIDLK